MEMNKAEALRAMNQGKKVTREYFSSDEYIYIDQDTGNMMSEDGFEFLEWWEKIEPTIPKTTEKPWSIYKESKK